MDYSIFNTVILRTPLISFERLESILSNEVKFLEFLSEPIVQEAIYVASPLLHGELMKYKSGHLKDKKEVTRLLSSLERYVSRMATRCTPFGLFAGCSTGKVGEETKVILEESFHRSTRFDMLYLCILSDTLLNKTEIKNIIKYYPNTSLYLIGDKYRYIEYKTNNNRRSYQISEVERSSYLKKLILHAEKGLTVEELASLLVSTEITVEDAVAYIYELIDSQVLQNELTQSVTGEDFFTRLIELLKTINYDAAYLSLLVDIQHDIWKLDNTEHDISLYEEINQKIKQLHIPFEEKYLFQVDMVRDTSISTIGLPVIEELKSTLTFLNKITSSQENATLNQFKQDFVARYENCEIPLMEVLDTELGIGYPSKGSDGDISPLIDDFAVPLRNNPNTPNGGTSPLYSILLKKAIECLSEGKKEIILTDEDIQNTKVEWKDLPPTISCMFNIIRSDEDETIIKLRSTGGSNAANLLARFAHTDKGIEDFVKEITFKEQELLRDVILAEIVHLPEARVGNILYRPHIREYEILYMANSDLPREQLIPVSDLMLSVKQGRLVIRSKRLNKEIVPRLTNAHNYNNRPLPVYRFLCDMQNQIGRKGLFFSWGSLENELSFCPRVRYKNTILSEASWKIKIKELESFFKINEDEKLIEEISKWRQTNELPRYVLMPDGDNELFIDWESILSIQSLFSIIKKRPAVQFKEFIHESEHTVVKDRNGDSYLNECVVGFYKKKI